MKYVTIGNMTIDEILFPDGRHATEQCGGNCLYAAVGARIWSEGVGIVSLVGSDFPSGWLSHVTEGGIDVQGIQERSAPHGMRAGLAYDEEGERTFIDDGKGGRGEYERTAFEWREWEEHSPLPTAWPERYRDALGVHLAPMPLPVLAEWTRALAGVGRMVTLDSPWWDGAAGSLEPDLQTMHMVNALLPSEAEVRVFFGETLPPPAAARSLGELAHCAVVVKAGAEGAWVYEPRSEAVHHVPPFPSNVVDPTGAGDAFCGGFLVGLTETGDVVEAVRYGTVSASFVIEGFGSLYALGTPRTEAERRRITLAPKTAQ